MCSDRVRRKPKHTSCPSLCKFPYLNFTRTYEIKNYFIATFPISICKNGVGLGKDIKKKILLLKKKKFTLESTCNCMSVTANKNILVN